MKKFFRRSLKLLVSRVVGEMEKEIRFLRAELQFVLNHMPKRPKPTEAEKARLAHDLDPKRLAQTCTFFSPYTLKAWWRKLIAKKWDYSHMRKKVGRPRISRELEKLVVRLAMENPGDGYDTLLGKLLDLGHSLSRETIRNILKRNGIPPSFDRDFNFSWKAFIRAHWEALAGTDFFTTEVLIGNKLVTHYVLFFIRLKTREVHIAGITPNPDGAWMKQVAKNLTQDEIGWLKPGMVVLHDRGGQYCPAFKRVLEEAGLKTVTLPPQSPNLNAFAERWVRTVKQQCLSKFLIVGEAMLRNLLREYLAFYHTERNHQGLGNLIPFPKSEVKNINLGGKIIKQTRLGLLNYYYREPLLSASNQKKIAV
jgi:putative transposase